jgi:hypothetical protein
MKIVCDTYQKSIPEYLEAIVEAMKSDIEEGNFCYVLDWTNLMEMIRKRKKE